jgi:hypothetical protein
MRRALAPLLFEDEQLELVRRRRDPVAKAEPSAAAKRKKAPKKTSEGLALHSFATLLEALATRCRNTCRVAGAAPGAAFEQLTQATELQRRAFELLGL